MAPCHKEADLVYEYMENNNMKANTNIYSTLRDNQQIKQLGNKGS